MTAWHYGMFKDEDICSLFAVLQIHANTEGCREVPGVQGVPLRAAHSRSVYVGSRKHSVKTLHAISNSLFWIKSLQRTVLGHLNLQSYQE